jgi:hypothetical protein
MVGLFFKPAGANLDEKLGIHQKGGGNDDGYGFQFVLAELGLGVPGADDHAASKWK